jgi:NAD(P)-dependent dehydrogenase (short-subunit alcohol dehydrogenase family)
MREIVTEEHAARVAANYPGGRIGEPDDIVALVNFPRSDAASHLSGTVITVRPPIIRRRIHADYDPRRRL